MNTRIDAIATAPTRAEASSRPAARRPAPARAPAPAPQATPAATVQLTSVPASVAADDRAVYLQILKANGGNAAAALAAVKAMEAKVQNG